jgi:hypothetical protein
VEPKEDENLIEERHTSVARGFEKRWRLTGVTRLCAIREIESKTLEYNDLHSTAKSAPSQQGI